MMPLIDLYGHDDLKSRLARAAESGSLPASLLFHGPRGIGKQRLALWLGQLLLCERAADGPRGPCAQCRFSTRLTHPDLHWVFPRPRPKDADPSLDEVNADLADAIAERADSGGL